MEGVLCSVTDKPPDFQARKNFRSLLRTSPPRSITSVWMPERPSMPQLFSCIDSSSPCVLPSSTSAGQTEMARVQPWTS